MAYHLLERDREGASHLAVSLLAAVEGVGHCSRCRTLSELELCHLCGDSRRESTRLCIVETPSDVHAVEQTNNYKGQYFVLMGHLSPLDGVGPEDIGLDVLQARFEIGGLDEVIIATNPTVEGEATAHYIAEMGHEAGIQVTRIAYGVPYGSELEYMDAGTLSHAMAGRRDI